MNTPRIFPTARSRRILLAGSWTWSWYERACADALRSLGHAVQPFSSFDLFLRWSAGRPEPVALSRWRQLENRLAAGPTVFRLNHQLERAVAEQQTEVLFLYNSRLVLPSTVRRIRRRHPRLFIVSYSNDNLFTKHPRPDIYRHIKNSVAEVHLALGYRPTDLPNLVAAGARNTGLLRSYFVPAEDVPVPADEIHGRYDCDVVFAGHFEPDHRIKMLEHLLVSGMGKFNLFGGGWRRARQQLMPESPLLNYVNTDPVVGDQYRQALCGAKIALCFLSGNNRDTYTRRSFQIPAMGVFQLSQFSTDLAAIFKEGREIEFFRDSQELVDKVGYYLRNQSARERIAEAGRNAVWAGGHDVTTRMAGLMTAIDDAEV